MNHLDRYAERALVLATFPWLLTAHVVGVIVLDTLELIEELRTP